MLDFSALPAVDEDVASFLSVFTQSVGILVGELPNAEPETNSLCVLEADFSQSVSMSGPICVLYFETEFGTFTLHIEQTAIDALSDLLLPTWRDETTAALPLDWRARYVLTEALERTGILPKTPQIQSFAVRQSGAPATVGLNARLTIGDVQTQALIEVITVDLKAVTARLAGHQGEPRKLIECDFPLSLLLTADTFSREEILRLGTGDLVIIPGAMPSHINVTGQLPGQISLSGVLRADGQLVAEHINRKDARMLDQEKEELPVSVEHETAKAEDDANGFAEQADLNALPVKLEFQFKSQVITLEDLSNLAPGAVLDLGLDLNDPININANGSLIGHGQLVQVGERVSVQITRWRKFQE